MYTPPAIIAEVGKILSETLTPKNAQEQLLAIEQIGFRLSEALVDQHQMVKEKRQQLIRPKELDPKATELDRTTRLNADVAIIERDYEFLLRIFDLIRDRRETVFYLLAGPNPNNVTIPDAS